MLEHSTNWLRRVGRLKSLADDVPSLLRRLAVVLASLLV
jgi:hypothetical protein